LSSGVILVRSNPSGIYFLVGAGEEAASLATIALCFPGVPLETLDRQGEYMLVRLVREQPPGLPAAEPPPSLRLVTLPGLPGRGAGPDSTGSASG